MLTCSSVLDTLARVFFAHSVVVGFAQRFRIPLSWVPAGTPKAQGPRESFWPDKLTTLNIDIFYEIKARCCVLVAPRSCTPAVKWALPSAPTALLSSRRLLTVLTRTKMALGIIPVFSNKSVSFRNFSLSSFSAQDWSAQQWQLLYAFLHG